jgi:hypothetical protein
MVSRVSETRAKQQPGSVHPRETESPILTRFSRRAGTAVNTKNWYRKETDLWTEFGKETPFDRKFSSKHSVKVLAVGSTPSFGRRAVLRWKRKHSGIRDDVA